MKIDPELREWFKSNWRVVVIVAGLAVVGCGNKVLESIGLALILIGIFAN